MVILPGFGKRQAQVIILGDNSRVNKGNVRKLNFFLWKDFQNCMLVMKTLDMILIFKSFKKFVVLKAK